MANKIEAEVVARLDANSFSRGLGQIKDRAQLTMRQMPRAIGGGGMSGIIGRALVSAREAERAASSVPGIHGSEMEEIDRVEGLTNTTGVYRQALSDVEQLREDAVANRSQRIHELAGHAGVAVDPWNQTAREILNSIHAGYQRAGSHSQSVIKGDLGSFRDEMFRSPEYMDRMDRAILGVSPEQRQAYEDRLTGDFFQKSLTAQAQRAIDEKIGQALGGAGDVAQLLDLAKQHPQSGPVIEGLLGPVGNALTDIVKNTHDMAQEMRHLRQEVQSARDDAG